MLEKNPSKAADHLDTMTTWIIDRWHSSRSVKEAGSERKTPGSEGHCLRKIPGILHNRSWTNLLTIKPWTEEKTRVIRSYLNIYFFFNFLPWIRLWLDSLFLCFTCLNYFLYFYEPRGDLLQGSKHDVGDILQSAYSQNSWFSLMFWKMIISKSTMNHKCIWHLNNCSMF